MSNSRPEITHANGVQLGGIGTGRIELASDGSIGVVGITHNWQRLIGGLDGTFFSLRAAWGTRSVFRVLKEGSHAGMRGVDRVAYRGRHPIAEAEYADRDLPARVSLTAFSPLVPHATNDSTIPGAVFVFRVRNLDHKPMRVELGFAWESILGCGGGGKSGEDLVCCRTGNATEAWSSTEAKGVRFTSPKREGYPAANHAGECVLAMLPPQGFEGRLLTAINALADLPALGEALTAGKLDCERFDPVEFADVDAWLSRKREARPPTWDDPDPRFGGGRQGLEGRVHPGGMVVAVGELGPQEEACVPFVLSWAVPCHVTTGEGGRDHGSAWQGRYSSAGEIAEDLMARREALLKKTRSLADLLDQSSLEPWLVDKLLNDTTPITTNSIVTRDGTLATLEASPMMWGSLGTIDQRLVSHPGTSLFYPDLNRTELQSFSRLQTPEGEITHFSGNAVEGMGKSGVGYGVTGWPDLSCSYIIQVYRDWMETGEPAFVEREWPAVLKAYEWLSGRDKDGDGIPEGGSSWDIEHYPGCFIVTATLWPATLRVMADLCVDMGRSDLLPRIKTQIAAALATLDTMWAGDTFRKYAAKGRSDGADDVFCGQLEGEWVVRQLGLEPVVSPERARTALETLYRLGGDENRYRLMPIQTRPDGTLPDRKYAWQSWPQYSMTFVDATAIYLGLGERGMRGVRQFDRTICELNRTPWATTLWYDARTGLPDFHFMGRDWYMNGPAIWWVLSALSGFSAREPRQSVVMGPWIPPGRGEMRYPVVTPRYWGWLSASERQGKTCLRLTPEKFFRGDSVELGQVRLRGSYKEVSASVNGTPLDAAVKASGVYSDVPLGKHLLLRAGETLEIEASGG